MVDRSILRAFVASMTVSGSLLCASAAPQIVPLQTSATFSAESPEKAWSVPIRAANGGTPYLLSLEPDFDVPHRIVTVELVLRRPGDKAGAQNLLDPTGKRHGLQPYDFAADDLANGVQRSAFGQKRTVVLKNLGLVVRIAVSKANVSSTSTGHYQIDLLNLEIQVDNV